MNKEEKLIIIEENIKAIENNQVEFQFINGGYSYSSNLTSLFSVLNEYSELYLNAHYSYDKKRDLEKNIDPESYSLIDCVVYFDWVWHVEGSGLATGIIKKNLENGNYLKALKRFKTLMEDII